MNTKFYIKELIYRSKMTVVFFTIKLDGICESKDFYEIFETHSNRVKDSVFELKQSMDKFLTIFQHIYMRCSFHNTSLGHSLRVVTSISPSTHQQIGR